MSTGQGSAHPVILHADPVRRSRVAIAEILRDLPFELAGADSLGKALEICEETPPACVLTEIRFSDGMVHDLVLGMKSLGVDVPVLLLSSDLSRETLEETIQLGIQGTLRKPPSPEEVEKAVKRALQRRGTEQSKSEKEGSAKATILVQDDVGIFRYRICGLLESKGYRTFQSENGQEGLRVLCEESVDLVITDLDMPEMNGLEFMKKLSEQNGHPPVIGLACTGDASMIREIGRYGVRTILAKPAEPELLCRVVDGIVTEKRESPSVQWGEGVVLFVEEDRAVCHAMDLLLKKRGLTSRCTANPQDAQDMVSSMPTVAAVVSMDLPAIDIVDLVRSLRGGRGSLPVVLTCRCLGTTEMRRASKAQATRVLEKPVDPTALVRYLAGFADVQEASPAEATAG